MPVERQGKILIYILTLIWSTYNRVLGSLLGPHVLFSETRQQQATFAPADLFCTRRPPLQSHISSGSSWGLRIPGTDIWSLCFSSWAWRRAASLSSKKRSVVSSPANSCRDHTSRGGRGFENLYIQTGQADVSQGKAGAAGALKGLNEFRLRL